MTERNEAAERLVGKGETQLRRRFDGWQYGEEWHAALDDALAAERRATVERIRERFNDLANLGFTAGGLKMGMKVILDEEAAR